MVLGMSSRQWRSFIDGLLFGIGDRSSEQSGLKQDQPAGDDRKYHQAKIVHLKLSFTVIHHFSLRKERSLICNAIMTRVSYQFCASLPSKCIDIRHEVVEVTD